MVNDSGDDDAVTFKVNKHTTFKDLKVDACKLWDRSYNNYCLKDEDDNVWPVSMKVIDTMDEMKMIRQSHIMRLKIKFDSLEGEVQPFLYNLRQ